MSTQPRTLSEIRKAFPGRTLVMGILNVTPDSFSDGGRYVAVDKAVEHALSMQAAGADMIDIGAESTRPGSESVDAAEECARLLPVLDALRKETDLPVSVDTTKAIVAQKALAAGADWINDVTALEGDAQMARVAVETGATVVLMHMQGTPRTMQASPQYDDVVGEVGAYLRARADAALQAGILPERILLDPGFGFGKTFAHNAALLRSLDTLGEIGYPLLVGMSRKRMIADVLDLPVEARTVPSVTLAALAAWEGAAVVRVHDVPETVQALRMADAVRRGVANDE